jgi:Cof subfamily protein (haloacid dehalogenase superfamily)
VPTVTPSRRSRPGAVGPIRLLALDIDGTLIGDDLVLRDRTIEAVGEAVRRGVLVSIVTGRMTSSALGYARGLGLTEPIVGYQGAIARDMPPAGDDRLLGRLLRHRPLDAGTAADILAWTRSTGLTPHFNHLEKLILPADDPRADDYSRFVGGRLTLVTGLDEWLAGRAWVTKVIAVGHDPAPMEAFPAAREAFAGRAEVTISHPNFLEFVAPGVSKGEALVWLARRRGIPLAEVMAIGDQFNDIEMIALAGHGVAMADAPEEVRAAARHVAPSVREEGAATIIEELVLGR